MGSLLDAVRIGLADMASVERQREHTKRDLGGVLFRERIAWAAELACACAPGDLLEIGVYNGATAEVLCAVAEKNRRKYVGIDNWLPHPDYRHDEMEPIARMAVEKYGQVGLLVKGDAHGDLGVATIRLHSWCFVLSDDGHEYAHHKAELDAALPVVGRGIIVVDDVYVPDAARAARDFSREHPRFVLVHEPGLREAYLVSEEASG